MSGRRGAFLVAASIGAVEALKDQAGFCRWNYALRSLKQHAKTNLSAYKSTRPSAYSSSYSSSPVRMVAERRMKEKMKRTEDSMKKVMDLSCLGPSSVRF